MDYMPTNITNRIFCVLWNYRSTAYTECVSVMANGQYLLGRPNDTFADVTIRHYYYTD
jgi:hypothetical protein